MNPFRTRILTLLGAITATVWVVVGSAAAPNTMLDPADPLALEVKGLHDDISLANLIRGLSLTGDQLEVLAEAAVAADTLRAAHTAEAQPLLAEMEVAFGGLRGELLAGGNPDPEVEQRALRTQRELQDMRREFERELADLEIQVRGVLDDGQVSIIEDFKPCLIPPKELGEPARVGQSDGGGRAVEVLGELRTLPQHTYERRMERFVERGLEIIELRAGPQGDEARESYRDRLTALVEEVRTLDDVTWALQGTEMARRLKGIVEGEDAGAPPPRRDEAELTRVGRLLLAHGSADVLTALAASH